MDEETAKDVVLHLPKWLSTESSTRPKDLKIIFFVTGNPGLIGYYEEFLELIARASEKAVVVGVSLGGFEVSGKTQTNDVETSLEDDLLFPPTFNRPEIFNLSDQIDLSWKRLLILIKKLKTDHTEAKDMPVEVVLMGHSVGAYIVLDMVQKHHEHHVVRLPENNFRIVSTMLLTPTIQDIAQSSSGKIATPLLSNLPFFPSLLQLGSSLLTSTLPVKWLEGLVWKVTGMKHAGALATTVRFLRQASAVRQALYMAKCEMSEIGVSKWKNEIWTVARADDSGAQSDAGRNWTPPKHFFLFAKEDHWVAQSTRDTIESSMIGKAVVKIDDGSLKLGHAWCLEQSGVVADIVNEWLLDSKSGS